MNKLAEEIEDIAKIDALCDADKSTLLSAAKQLRALPVYEDTGMPFVPELDDAWVVSSGRVFQAAEWFFSAAETWRAVFFNDWSGDHENEGLPFFSTPQAAQSAAERQGQ